MDRIRLSNMPKLKSPILLLRGINSDSRYWLDFPNEFDEDIKILIVDLPGTGKNLESKTPLSISEHVKFLRNQINPDHLSRGMHIIGLSLGGMIAIQWLSMFPNEIKSVTAMSSTGGKFFSSITRINPINWFKLTFSMTVDKIFRTNFFPKNLVSVVTNIPKDSSRNNWILTKFTSLGNESRVPMFSTLRQIIAASRWSPDFSNSPKLGNRVLLLKAQHDRFIPPKAVNRLHNMIPNSVLHEISSGHQISLSHPVEVIELSISHFLDWEK